MQSGYLWFCSHFIKAISLCKNKKYKNSILCWSSQQGCFVKEDVFKTFANLTRKHLCCSLAGLKACNFIKKRIQHRCFPVKLMKFLITLILKNICKGLLLIIKLGFWDIFVKKYDFRELLSFFEKKSFVKDCGT